MRPAYRYGEGALDGTGVLVFVIISNVLPDRGRGNIDWDVVTFRLFCVLFVI